ncbi:Hypothetical protein, putative [Bodo saltans]|uniref:Uncharacterized protein n=1 Tax=Bodo saltans TaxID=75058 RepID=A0A0S4IJM2_BODSA|nr:Hypothetical protein, putative [Bodo saltans]|eukprot:CUE89991.1 Hypothetical protein, putative [Bodo saltans]
MPPKIVELKAQMANRSANASSDTSATAGGTAPNSGHSASTAILERIKTNQANRGEGTACVFQGLTLDATVVRQLQDMKEFREMMPAEFATMGMTTGGGPGGRGGGGVSRGGRSARVTQVKPKKATHHSNANGDGPSILIPVTSERIRIADMKDALRDEYAARYCEHIGVAPTQQNMSLVLKLMPFEKCHISQNTQHNGIGRTERRNNVVIQPCVVAPPPDGPNAEDVPFELLTLEALQRVGNTISSAQLPPIGGEVPTSPSPPPPTGTASVGKVIFEAYKNQFVYPYNLEERFTTKGVAPTTSPHPPPRGGPKNDSHRGQPLPLTRSSREHSRHEEAPHHQDDAVEPSALQRLAVQDALLSKLRDQSEKRGGGITEDELSAIESKMRPRHGQQGSGAGSVSSRRDGGSDEEEDADVNSDASGDQRKPPSIANSIESDRAARRDAAAQKELTQPWTEPDMTEVRSLQVQFVKDFPFYRFEGRLSEAEVLEVKASLLGEDISELLIAIMNFAFLVYLAPQQTNYPRALDHVDKDVEFVLMCRKAIRFSNHRQRSPLAADALPLCLLMLRVLVDALFTARYPLLRRVQEGMDLQLRMDALVRAVLDPYGLQSHIVVLESTPQAQRVLRTKRLPQRMSAAATTPLVQFIIGDGAKSIEAKRMTRSAQVHPDIEAGLAELRRHLTPSVRAELLRVVTEERIQRDV